MHNPFVLRCHVSTYEWMICVKMINCIFPLVVLDNFYKVNCFLLIFFAFLLPLRGSLLLYSYFRGLWAFYDFAIGKNAS